MSMKVDGLSISPPTSAGFLPAPPAVLALETKTGFGFRQNRIWILAPS